MKFDDEVFSRVEKVDIVSLSRVVPDRVSEYMQRAVNEPRRTVDGETSERICRLWRSLTLGSQARCHSPPYGLVFHARDVEPINVSICWECDNIFGFHGSTELHWAFDSSTVQARELLAAIKELMASGEG